MHLHWKNFSMLSRIPGRSVSPLTIVLRSGSEEISASKAPSAIAALAEGALEADISSLPLRSTIVSGDTLLPGMRLSIEKFFQCRCIDHYGQAEAVAMATECLQ